MPKSIIREFDNSNVGVSLSSNFSVLVPGYIGTPGGLSDSEITKLATGDYTAEDALKDEAKGAGIYFADTAIYRITSTSQFLRYIGLHDGAAHSPEAPELEVFNPGASLSDAYNDGNLILYSSTLSVKEFANVTDACFYEGVVIDDTTNKDYGKNGKLLKTFVLDGNTTKTIKFIKRSIEDLWDDLPTASEAEGSSEIVYGRTAHRYYKIKLGKEGTNEAAATDHIGNKIAYELLKLGYTIYFKVIESLNDLENPDFWEPVKNKSSYRIRYITSGGYCNSDCAKLMVGVARFFNGNDKDAKLSEVDVYGYDQYGRGDCIALLDVDETDTECFGTTPLTSRAQILTAFSKAARKLPHNKYAAIFAPRVMYADDAKTLYPCSFHYLACAIQAQSRFAEWYAVAGYTRGISSKSIAYTTYTFGDVDINTLAPRVANDYIKAGDSAINLILAERGSYYLWGNRTAEPIDAKGLRFSHFLNIRQLCCTLKQVLYDATRQFTFDPNSDLLWINFVNTIKPTLESMKADQGIAGYLISKVASSEKAVLKANIRIVPIEAVEDFDISIYLEDSLSGVILAADEKEAE